MVVAMGTVHMTCLPARRAGMDWGVIGNGGVDMDGVDFGILEELVVACVALWNVELVGDLVHFLLVAATNGDEVYVRVGLVDGNELGSEAEPDDGDVVDVLTHDLWLNGFAI